MAPPQGIKRRYTEPLPHSAPGSSRLFPTGRPEVFDPGEPFSPQPHPSCSACPDRALPRHALLHAAAAARRGGLGTPPAPRATMAADGGERRERRDRDIPGPYRGAPSPLPGSRQAAVETILDLQRRFAGRGIDVDALLDAQRQERERA
jgi:hypothetical protein